jgi:hypothetical protein
MMLTPLEEAELLPHTPTSETDEWCLCCVCQQDFRGCRMRIMQGEDSNLLGPIPFCFSVDLKDRPPPFNERSQFDRSVCPLCFEEWQDQHIVRPNVKLLELVNDIVHERVSCRDCHKPATLRRHVRWEDMYSPFLRIQETDRTTEDIRDQLLMLVESERFCFVLTDSGLQCDLGPEWTVYSTCDKVLHREGMCLMDWGKAEKEIKQLLGAVLSFYPPLVSLIVGYSDVDVTLLAAIDGTEEKNLAGALWCLDCAKSKKMRFLHVIQCDLCGREEHSLVEPRDAEGISCVMTRESKIITAGDGSCYDGETWEIGFLPRWISSLLTTSSHVDVCDTCIEKGVKDGWLKSIRNS